MDALGGVKISPSTRALLNLAASRVSAPAVPQSLLWTAGIHRQRLEASLCRNLDGPEMASQISYAPVKSTVSASFPKANCPPAKPAAERRFLRRGVIINASSFRPIFLKVKTSRCSIRTNKKQQNIYI
jgi:hypothetical protein